MAAVVQIFYEFNAPDFLSLLVLVAGLAGRGPQCAGERERDRRVLDAGCVLGDAGISCTVRQRRQPVSLALDGRLAALRGWMLEALRAPGA